MMKNLIVIFILFIEAITYGQDKNIGGSPVEGVIPIKREQTNNVTTKTEDFSKATNTLSRSSNPTGNSQEVGVTQGQLSVSLSGGAIYNIPIAVPPGINGVVPQVALNYNSQGGNGLAGYGWNVSGVSVITRISSTKFHENINDPVDFDNNDRFALDGQRLIIKNGTVGIYGANNTVYETESFSNVQITSYGVHPNGANYGPAYFIVQYPDGSIAQYGNSSDSYSKTDWAITYWQNPQGLRISYNYVQSNNNMSISSIKYGTLLNATPINEIQFVYRTRLRPEQAYVGGESFFRNTILSEIRVKGNGIGFRNYFLEHESTSLGYERLRSITEKSGDNTKSYNPTIFNYETTTNTNLFDVSPPTTLNLNNINFTNSANLSGDFDGDGKMDFMLFPTTGSNAKSKYWLFNNIQGTTTNIGVEHNVGPFQGIFPMTWLSWNNKLMPMQGWCVVKNNNEQNYTFTVYSIGTVAPIYYQYEKTVTFPTVNVAIGECGGHCEPGGFEDKIIPKKIISGDFNGDGLTDAIAIDLGISNYYCSPDHYYGEQCETIQDPILSKKIYFIDLKRDLTSNYAALAGELESYIIYSTDIQVADYNADGKTDILVFDSGAVRVYTLNENNQFILILTKIDGSIIWDKPKLLGDYNGDGKIDFLIPQADASDNWSFFYSSGNNFVKNTSSIGMPYNISNFGNYVDYGITSNTVSLNEISFIPNDYNGDGKTDLLRISNLTAECVYQNNECNYSYQGTPEATGFFLLENKSSNLNSTAFNIIQPITHLTGINRYPIPIFLDHNNLNKNLEIGLLSGNSIRTFKSTKDSRRDVRLREITLGNGVKDLITYSGLDYIDPNGFQDYQYYPSTYTESYPNFDIAVAPSFEVVTTLENICQTGYKKQKYKYYGAVSNTEGLGFLGFRGLLRTNWFNDDFPEITSVSKHDITKRGAISETYTVVGGQSCALSNITPSVFINKANMTYVDVLLPNKVFKIKNVFSVSSNGLDGTSKEVTTTYDAYNIPLSSTTVAKKGATVEQTQTTTLDYYPPSLAPIYYVGRVKSKNTSVSEGTDTKTGEELYFYNSSNLLSQVKKKGHLTNYITEDNLYDVFGNITKKTITAVGLTPRVSEYLYDSSGRFLISSKDLESQESIYTYNPSNGLMLTETSPSNPNYLLKTTFDYDIWGKQKTVTDYLGKKTQFSYESLGGVNNNIAITGDDDSFSYTEYDQLGRAVKKSQRNIDLKQSTIKTEYDIYDREVSVSEPYNGLGNDGPTQFNKSEYDQYGRIIKRVSNTGKITNVTYNGLTTIVADNTKTVTTIKNSVGNLVSMTDNGGTITYEYYAGGNLKKSNYEGTAINIEYDGWGRKKKLDDPSAGIYTYEYNDLGETTKEITPKGTTTYTLNNVGKLIEKTIVGDGTNSKSTYSYDTTSKLLLNTSFDDYIESTSTIYSSIYDNYKRVTGNVEENDMVYLEHYTDYDAFGRPNVETYTSTSNETGEMSTTKVKNSYKNGAHWQILDNATSQILWQTNTVNTNGQLTGGVYGNGIEITNSYDQYGFPTQFKHEKPGTSPINVMTLNTVFETQRGNLVSRSNSMFNWNETFQYDNLDRLTHYNNAQGQQIEQIYDNKGRIDQNSLGKYNYNDSSGKVYRNTSVDINKEANSYYANRRGIFNDSMEEGSGWNLDIGWGSESPTILYDGTKAKTGNKSLKISNTTSSEKTVQNDKWIAIDNAVATQYIYSAWVYSDSPQSQIFLFMKTEGETAPYTSFDNIVSNATDGWVLVTKTVTIPANIKKIALRLDNNGLGNVWFDDVNIRKSGRTSFTQELSVTYNTFKSPVTIQESNIDILSFTYNAGNDRSVMFYGGLEGDKYQRALRKYYSADGSTEIKRNIKTGKIEFLTYIGGDGYSAPVVSKSDGTTQEYLYLHRDYQGSILAITNQSGNVVEKRLFDAWGSIIKIQNGAGNNLTDLTVLDRGYTGHEHLQSVGLIHMNGRLYDPKLHRFMQPDNFVQDPYNTQNYNRYGYVLNNPTKFTDQSGEFFWMAVIVGAVIGAASGAVGYIASAIQSGNWSWSQFGLSVVCGAVIGGISGGIAQQACTITMSAIGNAAASSFAAGFMPVMNFPIGDWGVSFSPSISFGNSSGIGFNVGVSYSEGDWSFSGGVGIMSYGNYNGFGKNGSEIRASILASYDDGKTGFSLGSNQWYGDFKQRTGMIGFHSGDVKGMYENDGGFGIKTLGLGNKGDSYRTAALNLSIGDFSAGFNLFTGKRINIKKKYADDLVIDGFGRKYPRNYVDEIDTPHRLGALSVGYKGYKCGVNSEHIRHAIQDKAIHGLIDDAGFRNQSWDWKGYSQYKTPNMFSSW